MIITRTPVRIPIGGGGTDLPSYYSKYEGFLITIDFHVDYLGKVKVAGETVRVKAQMVREGRNIVHFIAQIKDKEGKLIATANSNNLITHYKPDYVKAVENVFKDG